jgi:hypothetical protein
MMPVEASPSAAPKPSPTPTGSGCESHGRSSLSLLTVTLIIAAAGLIQCMRPGLVEQLRRAKDKYDIYALPKPQYVVAMSLGYRSAVADLLFAHTLVSSGIHLSEKRRFEAAASLLRTINQLDPKFATPYRFADTILTVQAAKPTFDDYLSARSILERGMDELKYDMQLWLSAGQFMAYLAPYHVGRLASEAVAKEWRHEGAKRLARSCELVGKDDNAPYHCVTAASLLSQAGEVAALRQFVERVVAVNDDPEVQSQALAALSKALGEEQKQKLSLRRERYERLRRRGLAFVGRDRFLLLGPGYDAFACLDAERAKAVDCATSFAEYHQRMDDASGNGS